MTTMTAAKMGTKARLLSEMKDIRVRIQSLGKDFERIAKTAKAAVKQTRAKHDKKTVDALRKKIRL